MPATHPVTITLPESGIRAAESLHAASFRMVPQEHEFHELFMVLRGKTTVELGASRSCTAGPGSIVVVPSATTHRFMDERATNLVVVAISDEALDNCPGRRELWNRIVAAHARCPGRACATVREHRPWRNLLALEQRGEITDRRLLQETMLNRLLCDVAAGLEEPRRAGAAERVQELLEGLPARIHEPWDLDRAAATTDLSRRRFSDLFRAAAGESFIATLQRLRIEAVQSLLAEGAHSIVGAAYTCGFEDLAHFYRVFRRHAGMPPGAWVQSREGTQNTE